LTKDISIEDISIRTEIRPGDLGYIIYLHGILYGKEYHYSPAFEIYVAKGLHEFYTQYDPLRDRVWICEHDQKIVGFLLLMHRSEKVAQLRFLILLPEFRGLGLGKLLLEKYMAFLRDSNYQSAFLWTTHEQVAAASLYILFGFKLTEEKESSDFGKSLTEQRYDFHNKPSSG
jgi:N-acetylglutamate synthase and related acetyltransferases